VVSPVPVGSWPVSCAGQDWQEKRENVKVEVRERENGERKKRKIRKNRKVRE
jgi:hypothetical protein